MALSSVSLELASKLSSPFCWLRPLPVSFPVKGEGHPSGGVPCPLPSAGARQPRTEQPGRRLPSGLPIGGRVSGTWASLQTSSQRSSPAEEQWVRCWGRHASRLSSFVGSRLPARSSLQQVFPAPGLRPPRRGPWLVVSRLSRFLHRHCSGANLVPRNATQACCNQSSCLTWSLPVSAPGGRTPSHPLRPTG